MGARRNRKIATRPPSGTRDFLAADIARREHVVGVVRRVFDGHGFVPLETPAIENLSTLLGKYGEEGDQLLYRLLHRRDSLTRALAREGVGEAELADQGLRYDLTVPLARVIAQYDLPRYYRRYQIQPVWRADRPGKGRFREFYQCDVDITGTSSPVAEAEVCAAGCAALDALGLADATLHVNHRQLLRALIRAAGIDPALEASALTAVDKLDKIGAAGVHAELVERGCAPAAAGELLAVTALGREDGPASLQAVDPALSERARALASAGEGEGPTAAGLRAFLAGDEEGLRALAELGDLLELLAATPAGPHARLSPHLARGLGYYTGAIFEVTTPDFAGSLAGGGRYDGLVGMFGKREVPAVGLSLGLERIALVMEERGLFAALAHGPEVLLCWMQVDPARVLACASALRTAGLRVEVYPERARKLGKQLQYADQGQVPLAAIIGEDELASGTVTLKHLASGAQERVELARAGERARALLAEQAGAGAEV